MKREMVRFHNGSKISFPVEYDRLEYLGCPIIVDDRVPADEIWGLKWKKGKLEVTITKMVRTTRWLRFLRFVRSLVGRGGRSR